MQFLNRCNGTSTKRLRLSSAAMRVYFEHKDKARADFRALAEKCGEGRRGFTFDGSDYYFGYRFLDDNAVLGRMESVLKSEAEFLADPYAWCLDALRDCASADHWYRFEKDWGHDDAD